MSHSDSVSLRLGSLVLVNGDVDLGSTSSVTYSTLQAPTALGNSSAVLTTAQFLSSMGTSTPGAAATFTTPTAAALVAAKSGTQIGDAFKISIINLSSVNSITLAAGTGVSIVGGAVVAPSSSSTFLVRFTGVVSGSQAVVIYRLS
jgi:hypothetical protein